MTDIPRNPLIDEDVWTGRLFGGPDGRWYTAGETRDVTEPATGERLTNIGLARAADVARAAKAAAAAQPAWAALPARDRAAIMRRAAAALERDLAHAARYIARETGGIPAKAQLEVAEAATQLHIAAGLPLQPQGLVLPSTAGRTSYARRVPHGVVGVISPFNFPLILSMRSVAPALALGNAVVLKPDPQTPVSGGYLIARAFEEAGLPPGVLQVVPGDADAGQAVVEAPEVRMIAFTGSTAAGRKVGELAGRLLKKVSLELGGKNTLVVLDDADLDLAASNAAFGAFFHQGQICMATGRILAHRTIAAELTRRLVEKANTLPVGDPASGTVAIGPLINARQLQHVDSIVRASVEAGAVLEAGGTYERLFYKPTVLSNARPGMRAFDEEIFGPVAVVTPFDSDDEAVELANQTEYGLSCAVIGTAVARATAIGERLRCGLLHINGTTVADECVNPFGGRGDSGNGGSMGGPADAEEYTQWQWVTVKGAVERTPF
ncbi:benzaldehyde dehydrogenase [Trinickia dabaoshanensis]|uniref:Benzaldehyde dehydrogenase n=1 Tax=Trinickia dabaoshanensis TaxID=564714 RepID=A0A2N7VI48_9BURK|nr:benzaldehyde dehydrogenase [Trinickia dabaoshanensis]PMS16832.1 benzaldehyde dehydrogenase [Trinickia dabaoshanensis]